MPKPSRPWIVPAVTATMPVTYAPGVRAEVVHEEPVTERHEYDYSDCGFPVHVEGEITVTASWRVGKTDASIHFYREIASVREVHTNPANNKWFVASGHDTFHDVNANHVDGNIYEISQVLAGQPTVITRIVRPGGPRPGQHPHTPAVRHRRRHRPGPPVRRILGVPSPRPARHRLLCLRRRARSASANASSSMTCGR